MRGLLSIRKYCYCGKLARWYYMAGKNEYYYCQTHWDVTNYYYFIYESSMNEMEVM